jgi:hypothetical protein
MLVTAIRAQSRTRFFTDAVDEEAGCNEARRGQR